MTNPLPTIIFFILAIIGYFVLGPNVAVPVSIGEYVGWILASIFLSSTLRMAAQWEKALVFRLGRFQAVKGPGVFTVIPMLDQVRMVDTRIFTVDIPSQ